jgi:hypothetical protein
VIEFLLEKCLWTVWYPSAAWRMKVDQIFNLTIVTRIRNDGILTKETRHLKLCLGRKWIGPHHSNQNEAEHIRKWLHRTDYETDDKIHTAYSEFFHTIDKAWQVYLEKLSQILNQEEFEKKIDKKIDFDPKQVERYPYLRIKYLLHTNVERILKEDRTFFRFAHEFEQWLMEKEDKDGAKIDEFCGSLYDAPIESLREYFENEHMKQEDSKALFF